MSRKVAFGEKVVTLKLGECRAVSFDPRKCEWAPMNEEDVRRQELERTIDGLSRQIDEKEKIVGKKVK